MSTVALQLQVQRHRFTHHVFAAFVARLPRRLRSLIEPSAVPDTAALQAQAVREMARTYQRTDPGFAADLFAAAARHEGLSAD